MTTYALNGHAVRVSPLNASPTDCVFEADRAVQNRIKGRTARNPWPRIGARWYRVINPVTRDLDH